MIKGVLLDADYKDVFGILSHGDNMFRILKNIFKYFVNQYAEYLELEQKLMRDDPESWARMKALNQNKNPFF